MSEDLGLSGLTVFFFLCTLVLVVAYGVAILYGLAHPAFKYSLISVFSSGLLLFLFVLLCWRSVNKDLEKVSAAVRGGSS